MLESVRKEVADYYYNDQMCQENYGSLHYTSESYFNTLPLKIIRKVRNEETLNEYEAHDVADCFSWDQICKISGEHFSDEFIREFAECFCWTILREHRYISLNLIIEFQIYVNITYFLEKGWIKKYDLIHFTSSNYINDSYLLRKGIFNKFDILVIK